MDDDRSDVLVVRVWLEDGTEGFRARLSTPGPWWGPGHDAVVTVAVASSPAAVSDAVHAWLRSFIRSATGPR